MQPKRILIVTSLVLLTAACGSSSSSSAKPRASARTSASPTSTTSAAPQTPNGSPCGKPGAAPRTYESVVVFSFENRSWDEVGLGFGEPMPYLHNLGTQCSWFAQWDEIDPHEKSLAQYVGQIIGKAEPNVPADCKPSASCNTTADSLFRQVRTSGRSAVNFVEGATGPCSSEGNKPKHIPALYLWGADDRKHCDEQVQSYDKFDPAHLPAFAFVTPTQCNDGHDCSDQVVDTWAKANVQPVLDSAAYRAGKVAVFIWYDESAPVPNLWITPTASGGARAGVQGSTAATLRAWQSMLGVPCLADACAAPDLRAPANS